MIVTKAVIARYFILGFINMLRFSVDDPMLKVAQAMKNEKVMHLTAEVATEFPYFAEYRDMENLLVGGYALLIDEMKLGDPEKIISGKAHDYVKDLANVIEGMIKKYPKPVTPQGPRPTEEIY